VWINCVQASVATVVFGVYLTWRWLRGRSLWPTVPVVLILMALGALTQLGGTSYQWSIGVIGLAISNPLVMGVMLGAAALMGLVLLGEPVTRRAIVAMSVMTLAIVVLGAGADEANKAMQDDDTAVAEAITVSDDTTVTEIATAATSAEGGGAWVLLGILAACFAGFAFASLTVGMRKTATEDTAPVAIVFFINLMGILFLGPWAMMRLGVDGMMATAPRDLLLMFGFGASNLLAFLLIAMALELTSVVRVNVLNNALATLLTVLAGLAIFAEPATVQVVAGITLMVIGIVLISYERTDEAPEEAPVAAPIEAALVGDDGRSPNGSEPDGNVPAGLQG